MIVSSSATGSTPGAVKSASATLVTPTLAVIAGSYEKMLYELPNYRACGAERNLLVHSVITNTVH